MLKEVDLLMYDDLPTSLTVKIERVVMIDKKHWKRQRSLG